MRTSLGKEGKEKNFLLDPFQRGLGTGASETGTYRLWRANAGWEQSTTRFASDSSQALSIVLVSRATRRFTVSFAKS